MSRHHRHIESHYKTINEESYDILQEPTNATFIAKETMETNTEEECLRQAGKVIYVESKLVKNQETKGQEKKESSHQTMESN